MRIALCAAIAFLLAAAPAHSQTTRGKYIVERIGMCGDCHTPRNAQGEPIAAQALHGAPIPFRPLHPMPFADTAPRIAGLPAGWTPAQTATFLQTGKRPDGSNPRPPMPPYRLSQQDAWAVVDYIELLK
jgi:mono/diheme cytochrome c family protein